MTFIISRIISLLYVKVRQDTLCHTDVSTTLNIYTDATKELKRVESEGLDRFELPQFVRTVQIGAPMVENIQI